jgi:pimeloyl-ACP methyl ester carboxylesterase
MVSARFLQDQPESSRRVLEMMRRTSPEGAAAALLGRAERPDYHDLLASLEIPATVIVGSDDAFTSRAQAELMHELLKGSELVWLEGVGHMPNLEAAPQFNSALDRLLDRVEAA